MSFIKAKDLDKIKKSSFDFSSNDLIKDLLFTGYNYVGEFAGEIFDGSTQQLFKNMENVDGNIISHDKEYFLWVSNKWNKLYEIDTANTKGFITNNISPYSYENVNFIDGTINYSYYESTN